MIEGKTLKVNWCNRSQIWKCKICAGFQYPQKWWNESIRQNTRVSRKNYLAPNDGNVLETHYNLHVRSIYIGLGHGTERHRDTQLCKTEAPRYQRSLKHLAEQESRKVVFNVWGDAIKRVSTFKYLGRIVSEDDDDTTPAIEENLKKAKAKWEVGNV